MNSGDRKHHAPGAVGSSAICHDTINKILEKQTETSYRIRCPSCPVNKVQIRWVCRVPRLAKECSNGVAHYADDKRPRSTWARTFDGCMFSFRVFTVCRECSEMENWVMSDGDYVICVNEKSPTRCWVSAYCSPQDFDAMSKLTALLIPASPGLGRK